MINVLQRGKNGKIGQIKHALLKKKTSNFYLVLFNLCLHDTNS